MGLLIEGITIHKVPEANLAALDLAFDRYERLLPTGSVEGLESIAGNIAVGVTDFIGKTGNNIKTALTDFDKDVKRSSLQILMESHRLGMMRVMEGSYSFLSNAVCNFYPFNESPLTVATFCKLTFNRMGMLERMTSLIENYRHLGAAISANDANLVARMISNIGSLNIGKQLNLKSQLSKMIVAATQSNKTTFGTVFSSMGDFEEVVSKTVSCSEEFNQSIKVSKNLHLLYGAFDDLKEVIQHAAGTKFDFSKLRGIGQIIHDTSSLIEDYAMLVKEYHHLEFWLTTTSEGLLKAAKK